MRISAQRSRSDEPPTNKFWHEINRAVNGMNAKSSWERQRFLPAAGELEYTIEVVTSPLAGSRTYLVLQWLAIRYVP
jgi:hypothetical protein